MTNFKLYAFLLLAFTLVVSCKTVRVATDYDKNVNFNSYKHFAFFKPGVDQAKISDLDKKRILRAIETELLSKGMNKSNAPDILVSIFTKEQEHINTYRNGLGWPYYGGGIGFGGSSIVTTEGSLYIDLIDAKTKELIWQGIGNARLVTNVNNTKREERIKKFVTEILTHYPPENNK